MLHNQNEVFNDQICENIHILNVWKMYEKRF